MTDQTIQTMFDGVDPKDVRKLTNMVVEYVLGDLVPLIANEVLSLSAEDQAAFEQRKSEFHRDIMDRIIQRKVQDIEAQDWDARFGLSKPKGDKPKLH